jgi:hypothetical protein
MLRDEPDGVTGGEEIATLTAFVRNDKERGDVIPDGTGDAARMRRECAGSPTSAHPLDLRCSQKEMASSHMNLHGVAVERKPPARAREEIATLRSQ